MIKIATYSLDFNSSEYLCLILKNSQTFPNSSTNLCIHQLSFVEKQGQKFSILEISTFHNINILKSFRNIILQKIHLSILDNSLIKLYFLFTVGIV